MMNQRITKNNKMATLHIQTWKPKIPLNEMKQYQAKTEKQSVNLHPEPTN